MKFTSDQDANKKKQEILCEAIKLFTAVVTVQGKEFDS